MTHMRIYNAEREEQLFFLPFVKKVFCDNNFKKLDRFNTFDFVNHKLKLFVEIKDLTNKYGEYKEICLGSNKISQGLKYIDQGYSVVFIIRWNKNHIGMLDLDKENAVSAGDKIIYNSPHKMFNLKLFTLIDDTDKIVISEC